MAPFFNVAHRSKSGKPSPPPVLPTHPSLAHRLKRMFGRAFCLIGFLGAIVSLLAGYLASLHIFFDPLNHFTVHFILLAFSCGICFFLPRFSLTSAVVLMGLGLCALGGYARLGPWPKEPPHTLQAGFLPLKVMSFNILYSNRDVLEVIDVIRKQDPDIVTFVEFAEHHIPILEELHTKWPYKKACTDHPRCNFAILSKIPLKEVEIPKDNADGGYVSPYFKVSFASPYNHFVVVGVHTSRIPFLTLQRNQLKNLKNYLNEIHEEKIVLGDFNATPFSHVNKEFAQNTHLRRITSLPSWPSYLSLPQIAIDHIFISKGISVLTPPSLGPSAGSDHYPVIATLSVPKS